MPSTKRKLSVSLDDDLVAELEQNSDALSIQVNAAVRNEVALRRRQKALALFLERLDEQSGPLDSVEDEAEIARYMRLLGGQS